MVTTGAMPVSFLFRASCRGQAAARLSVLASGRPSPLELTSGPVKGVLRGRATQRADARIWPPRVGVLVRARR